MSAFEDSRALSALRIAVALLLLISPELHQAEALAARPDLLEFVPEGAGWLAALHLTPSAAHVLRLIALSSGALALLGFHARAALGVLTCAALPLYALSQFGGTVLHDMHLFWFSALLALSPCADVWALDSWGTRPVRAASEYAAPATVCRALLGVVYFFPGLHKLLESGWAWGNAEHVLAQMHAKWFELGAVPAFRIDHYPRLCSLGGHAVLLFELGFLPLALWRTTRPIALVLGLGFHWATQAFFFIPFMSLWACYGVLVPWSVVLRPKRVRSVRPARGLPRPALPALAFGVPLLLLAIFQGFRGHTQAWPVACYPTFATLTGDTLPDLLVEAEAPDGARITFTGRERGPRTQAEWGRVFRISGAYGDAPALSALREHALAVAERAGIALAPGSILSVYRADYATAPELWNRAPRNATLLSSFRLESLGAR
jgi:hypothetical protein